MQKSSTAKARNPLLLCVFILGLMTALVILPIQFRTEAGGQKGLLNRTESHVPGLENYDIRTAKAVDASDALMKYRQSSGKDAAMTADITEGFVRGEEALRTKVPTLKVEYNPELRNPEVITPDVWKSDIERLSGPSSLKRSEILRNFVKENSSLIGVDEQEAASLKVTADYTNPDGNISYAHLEQRINNIPVFRSEIKAGFTRSGEMIRVINNLAPGLDNDSLSSDFRNPLDAVKSAFRHINAEPTKLDVEVNSAASSDLKTVFGNGDWATTAEKMYFPTEPGVAIPSWRILIWQPVNAFYVIVDTEGTMLWRKNITEDQTQAATYQIYNNTNAFMKAADSPAPLSPGPIDPTLGTQGALLTRSNVTLIGNEAPNTFNNNGWITDAANVTDGNALEAGIDRDGTNGVDAPQTGSPTRIFDSTWNPAPGSPAPGDDPLTAQAQRGAVIQMFYVMNRYHDSMYERGFTEAAFNFQTDNFARGGAGADRISAEGQDSSGTNNANFSTPADGGRGRMQMFVWTGPTPDYDGTADAEVIIHEATHGTSNRLHGNASGLSTNMARGMGEGWSDFYSYTLLAEPTDPINGIYTTGGYATYLISAGFTGNYYYGIRRFPRAPITFLGANGKPHNPFTFRYVNADCNTLIGTTTSNPPPNSAFPRGPIGVTTCDQVHNIGEIWSSMLWEVRNRLVTRLGFTAGTTRALQVVTDGMKLAPIGPTILQERDAIIAAAAALPLAPEAAADVVDVREGFRVRGAGFSAAVTNAGTGANNTVVVEAFDLPNVVMTNPFSVNDSTGNNNGVPEPGENVLLSVAITNTTGATVNAVTANVNGGPNVAYGNMANGATVSMNIPFAIPGAAPCGSTQMVTINIGSAIGAQSPQMRSFVLGSPAGITQNFDGVTPPALPAGWTTTQDSGTGITWATTATGPNSAPNSAFANDPATVNMSSLVSPAVPITSTAAQLSFKNKYVTESTFDGMVLEIANPSVNAGAFQDIVTAGGTFVSGGYNATISTSFTSPIGGRMAWSGTSAGGYIDTVVTLPANANGNSVQFRWRMASDSSVASTGVNVDDVAIVSSYTCAPAISVKSRADFDGDGKTDLSIFRPSEGNWYLNRSTAGFQVLNWGLAADVLTPGDYDGDSKTDTAVFRATADPAQPDFYILNSNGFTLTGASWGLAGDVPVVTDYDGDGKADIAVFRPSNNTWYVIKSAGGTTVTTFGQAGDVPVAGDFDGDGKGDLTVYRAGSWLRQLSGGGSSNVSLGSAGDILVPADYDGDNKDDVAVFRPSTGQWFVTKSSDSMTVITVWGASGDVPVPGDYDGDGKDDYAIYRNGQWWLNRSTSGIAVANFGIATDKAIPRSYVP
ncbi:MAG: M36 family metallopeptidase [Acidobacteria bacterium]|nr:M36 family metallopeptidase [Acidobacteriota bacterium]